MFRLIRDELYQLLDVERRATAVEIKRAYRNKSLQMHPDKLNQRGQEVTEQNRADFQKMKGAYDVSHESRVVATGRRHGDTLFSVCFFDNAR